VTRMLYCYPMWHTVSFTLVARKHVEYVRRQGLAPVHEIDELTLPTFVPQLRYSLVVHPHIYIYDRVRTTRYNALSDALKDGFDKYMAWWRSNYEQVIGIDVCDSDRIGDYAVALLNEADKVIVPSNFAREVCARSGVRRPVHVLWHGVDPEWYSEPNVWESGPRQPVNAAVAFPYLFKLKTKRRVLLYWLWHSAERKGWFEVAEMYERLVRERSDVVLVMKTPVKDVPGVVQLKKKLGELGVIQVFGWVSDYEKMALYDLADITLNFSRGGGFELNGLESLARGVPCVASNWGSWVDYMPGFLTVRTGEKVVVLPGNSIHVGYGYKVDVESALDKVCDILDNYDEYRARTEEWRQKVLAPKFRWDVVARRLVEIVTES